MKQLQFCNALFMHTPFTCMFVERKCQGMVQSHIHAVSVNAVQSLQKGFSIKAEYARLLEKQFCVLVNDCDVLCSKFRLKCYRMENKRITNIPCLEYDGNQVTFDEFEPPTKQGRTKYQTPSSPPSVTLSLLTTSKSHAYCFICKKPGPKIIVAPSSARQGVFIRRGIVVSAEVRCCPYHS